MPKIIDNAEKMILQSARKILLDGSFRDFSMRNVANDCGIGVGTIYNYYPGKLVLIAKVMGEDWENAKEKMQEAAENAGSVPEGLTAIYHAIKAFTTLYYPIWNQYAEGNETSEMLQKYHPMLQEQINGKINRLLERFGYEEDQKITPILSEAVISASTKSQISVEQVRMLGERLFDK
ncbi:MAG: TetR/AcrR family transcriptional regulator [Erysipelotrichales bacterium]|nr:TetR/AcrR family transcriptional regulator [Erysipelotrichales bacterium]MBQ1386499.1 TetR/AcrR family transcriptional regulator [Erysipelotrichales bacterium]MBQ2310065.1 TetR/AcrR family transcriptional regulator [Erysipelotrichales bacterium]MBQ4011348.1 TetR/AcrR family transcriptional regulator [Erysipelotrichales bacterium]MBQ4374165.1 TetR/AcrR family transcriptional regulator [Erysipelotrichales bacterium]